LGHLQIHRAEHRYAGGGRRMTLIYDPTPLVRRIEKLDGVEDVMVRLSFEAVLNNGRADIPIQGVGIEPEKENRLGSFVTIIAGRQLNDSNPYEILLGEGVAAAAKLKPGDRATLVTNTAEGELNSLDFTVAGVFRTFSREYDSRTVRMPLTATQELLNVRAVDAIVISLKETGSTDKIAAVLKQQLNPSTYKIETWKQLADFYDKTAALYRRQFLVMEIIVLIAVVLSVASSVNMSVFERTGEIGTLMALGNRRRAVFRLLLTENLLLGLIGGALGALLGMLFAWGISAVGIPMPPPPNSNSGYVAHIRVVPWIVASAFLAGFVATIVAALLPARRVSRLPVTEALRQNY
jgi:putative ABC transport system permease protein